MKYKGIIFDLDGVLCHTDGLHYQAWQELALRIGVPFDPEKNARLKGLSRMDSLEQLLGRWRADFSTDEKKALADEKNRRYLELLEARGKALLDPDAPGVLAAARALGLRIAIGSSSKNAKRILELLGIGGSIDVLVDGTDIVRGKPDPEVFLLAAQQLGLEPGVCLVVEDAASGIQAATAAGMDSVFLDGEKETGDDGETYRIRRLTELLLLLQPENPGGTENGGLA